MEFCLSVGLTFMGVPVKARHPLQVSLFTYNQREDFQTDYKAVDLTSIETASLQRLIPKDSRLWN